LLSKKTLLTLRQYSLQYQPKKWLLEGEDGGQYTDSSIYSILKKALTASKNYEKGFLHSFATQIYKQINKLDRCNST
jgi:hypothetical protein